jgi:DNA-binding MarR family transcriptional regulator
MHIPHRQSSFDSVIVDIGNYLSKVKPMHDDAPPSLSATIRTVRAFNRFHTRYAGVLEASFMGSGFSLAEARILYEIGERASALASDIQTDMGLDAGYLSRLVRRLEGRGLIERGRGKDGRQRPMTLTPAGRDALARIDAKVYRQTADSLAHLNPSQCEALTAALRTAAALLGGDAVIP